MKKLKLFLMFALLLGSIGLSAQTNIKAPEDKALVYVLRPSYYGALVKMKIKCDGEDVGRTFGKRYIYTEVSPGQHTFTSKKIKEASLTYNFEAGKTYFIKQKIRPGWIAARNEFELVEDVETSKLFTKCKLSKHQIKNELASKSN